MTITPVYTGKSVPDYSDPDADGDNPRIYGEKYNGEWLDIFDVTITPVYTGKRASIIKGFSDFQNSFFRH